MEGSQFITDVGNWSHIQAGTAATLIAMTGRATWAQLKSLTVPLMSSLPPMIKSVPLLAAAGGAAVAAPAAATAAAAGAGSLIMLKRPLAAGGMAAGGVAAAGGFVMVGDSGVVGGNATGRMGRGMGAPGGLQVLGEKISKGFRGAAMALRRNALAGGGEAAAAGRVRGKGWFLQPWGPLLAPAAAARGGGVMEGLAAGAAAAATGGGRGRRRFAATAATAAAEGGGGGGSRNGVAVGFGRHMMWLGSTAARATASFAAAASRRMGFKGRHGQHAASATAVGLDGGMAVAGATLMRSSSSGSSRMASAQAMAAAPAVAAAMRCARPAEPMGWGPAGVSGSGRGTGGRQTLHLPVPRLTWVTKNKKNMVA